MLQQEDGTWTGTGTGAGKRPQKCSHIIILGSNFCIYVEHNNLQMCLNICPISGPVYEGQRGGCCLVVVIVMMIIIALCVIVYVIFCVCFQFNRYFEHPVKVLITCNTL